MVRETLQSAHEIEKKRSQVNERSLSWKKSQNHKSHKMPQKWREKLGERRKSTFSIKVYENERQTCVAQIYPTKYVRRKKNAIDRSIFRLSHLCRWNISSLFFFFFFCCRSSSLLSFSTRFHPYLLSYRSMPKAESATKFNSRNRTVSLASLHLSFYFVLSL